MKKKLFILFTFIVQLTTSTNAFAGALIPKEDALFKINYWQNEMKTLDIKVTIDFDWNGISKVETLNNLPNERGQHAAFLIGQVGYGFHALAKRDEEIKNALVSDVKKIRITNDSSLDKDPTVNIKNGLATVKFNYSKYRASNIGPEISHLVHKALPSATTAAVNRQKKVIEEVIANKTKIFLTDELLDLKLEIRWNEFEGSDLATFKGLEKLVDKVSDDLLHMCGFTSSKPVLKMKVTTISIGALNEKDSTPVQISHNDKKLSISMPIKTLSDESADMRIRSELMRALEIQELKNK